MLRPVLTVALLATALLEPRAASAKVPCPPFCTVDPVLVGDASGSHGFRVALREVTNSPLYSELVTLDFSGTTVRLYSTQEAGTTLDCAARTLSRVTDHDGVAVFHPRFGGACNSSSIVVSGNGVVVAQVPARSTDMDGLGGSAGLPDFARFGALYEEPAAQHPEADFDGSGVLIGLGDFAVFAHDFALDSAASYCP